MSHLIVNSVDKTLDHVYVNTGGIVKEAWEARDKNDHLLWGRADTFTGTNSISARCYGLPVKSWEIDGNSQQTGTPAPDDPIYPEFVVERTENICKLGTTTTFRGVTCTVENDGTVVVSGRITSADESISIRVSVDIYGDGDYIFSGCPEGGSNDTYYAYMWDYTAGAMCKRWDGTTAVYNETGSGQQVKIISGHTVGYCIRVSAGVTYENLIFKPMIRLRNTTADFEPYGYKLPITSAGQTVPVYLGQVQTLRRIKKLVFTGEETWTLRSAGSGIYYTNIAGYLKIKNVVTCICSHYTAQANVNGWTDVQDKKVTFYAGGETSTLLYIRDTDYASANAFKQFLSDQYAAGTPVTVWYVLATPETGIVNEPLAKIGTYTDTLTSDQAGITVPTTDGNNTISVDTSLAPSKFEVKVHAKPIAGT